MAGFSCEREAGRREDGVMYRAFQGLGAKGRMGGPEAMS